MADEHSMNVKNLIQPVGILFQLHVVLLHVACGAMW